MKEFQKIFELIESRTGIEVNVAHRNFVIGAVTKRIEELSKEHPEIKSVDEYINFIEENKNEENELINIASINETYFFREENQFDFLKENFFPNYSGKQVTIWSAACSSGEEAVSLYALAKSLDCQPIIFATDIDTKILAKMKIGSWLKSSFRGDGKKYTHLLEELGTTTDDTWTIPKKDFSNFNISQFNLVLDNQFPMPLESVDLIFIRNVFIYFNKENQNLILRKMCQALKPGGLLFLSVSEVASIDNLEGTSFVKEHTGSIYYFRKITESELKKLKEEKKNRRTTGTIVAKKSEHKIITVQKPKKDTVQTKISTAPVSEKSQKEISPITSIEELAAEVSKLSSEKKYDDAKNLLESHNFKSQNIEYKFYLYGKLYDVMGEQKKAQSILGKAIIANPKFWPAYFKLGLLYSAEKQNAKKIESFTKCKELLEKSIAENKTEYDFIVEAFDLSYFVKLCNYYLTGK